MGNLTELTPEQFLDELFGDEYCDECGGDQPHHDAIPFMGNWFARCKQPIASGVIVETQHGAPEHRGVVLDEVHPLTDWIWVEWEHVGRADEWVKDVTIATDEHGYIMRREAT